MKIDELLALVEQCNVSLSIDGSELVVRGDAAKLDQGLIAMLREHKADLVMYLRGGLPEDCEQITPEMLSLVSLQPEQVERIVERVPGGARNVQDVYPLAPLQEGLLFHHLFLEEGDPYLTQMVYRFTDRSTVNEFVAAFTRVIDRHDILRTAVLWEHLSEPVQVVLRHAKLVVEEITFDPNDDALEQLAARFNSRSFRLDITKAPLLHVAIVRDGHTDSWLVAILIHHLAGDHVTLETIQNEIFSILNGREDELAKPVPFRNFVTEARSRASSEKDDSFFREMLSCVTEPTAPFGLCNVTGDGSNIVQSRVELNADISAQIRVLARTHVVTPASIFHLAWARVLMATCGRDDVVFGTVLLGRTRGGDGADRALGLFINTLPIRIVGGEIPVTTALRDTHSLLARLMHHEHVSLAHAQRSSGVEPPAPLFSTVLNYRNNAEASNSRDARNAMGIELIRALERTNYPLALSIDDLVHSFVLTVQADRAIDPKSVCDMMECALISLADALQHTSPVSVCHLNVLPELERERQLNKWNATAVPFSLERCLHEIFEAQVARVPDRPAVVFDDVTVTYHELNQRANRLATHLRALGVGPDVRVALCVRRSIEMVEAIWAVLKAGGAYVPLDANYPAARIQYMLSDSDPAVVLTNPDVPEEIRKLLDSLGKPVLDLVRDRACWSHLSSSNLSRGRLESTNLAYVIYTSGSTGQPKGVMIEHRGLCNLAMVQNERLEITESSRVLQFVSLSFDASVLEIVLTFCHGASLRIVPHSVLLAGATLIETIREQEITHAVLPPAVLAALPGDADLTPLQILMVGGEAPTRVLVERFGSGRRFVNTYGPAETTVFVALHDCDPAYQGIPPIGYPTSNARMYILDAHSEPVPAGVSGELYIGGVQVARGYLNRPALTASRFLADPFSGEPGARMYRTGDLARRLSDGRIEFLGRNDFQVKIRGFRIELGEIEAALIRHHAIREAVVVVREDIPGEKRLVAYYVVAERLPKVNNDELRTALQAELPEYMVPAAYMALDSIPLTSNGKLDRHALPIPDMSSYVSRAYEPPIGETEIAIARVWCDILRVERVGRNDGFFDLGGHSLLAMRLISRLRSELGFELRLSDLFARPRLRDVVTSMQIALSELPRITRAKRGGVIPLSYAQQRLWFLAQMEGIGSTYHIPVERHA
ncbi:MAG: non-ribosomal peptide synthetase [Vulcanimicrobiaceae bacterium]